MKKTMIASQAMTYGTRRLKAGDEFSVPRRDAGILVRIGRARVPDDKPSAEDELTALRAEYQDVVGKRAYHAWDADELRKKVAEAKKD
ncbi:hypothetical protein [Pelagibacterium sp.]|uniref:hypothetical protein n=1 Tax=Pelagibacterium sp. TaxID=1967288 RepID=UPI003A93C0A9